MTLWALLIHAINVHSRTVTCVRLRLTRVCVHQRRVSVGRVRAGRRLRHGHRRPTSPATSAGSRLSAALRPPSRRSRSRSPTDPPTKTPTKSRPPATHQHGFGQPVYLAQRPSLRGLLSHHPKSPLQASEGSPQPPRAPLTSSEVSPPSFRRLLSQQSSASTRWIHSPASERMNSSRTVRSCPLPLPP